MATKKQTSNAETSNADAAQKLYGGVITRPPVTRVVAEQQHTKVRLVKPRGTHAHSK